MTYSKEFVEALRLTSKKFEGKRHKGCICWELSETFPAELEAALDTYGLEKGEMCSYSGEEWGRSYYSKVTEGIPDTIRATYCAFLADVIEDEVEK